MSREQRRLAAIVAADVVGYSRLMGRNEIGTLQAMKELRQGLIGGRVSEHGGRIVKSTGDGLLMEFPSIVNATRCALAMQHEIAASNVDVPAEERIQFRIGIHVGDIIVDDDDIFGDGVNVAARLEPLAAPGGVCLSDRAYRDIQGRIDAAFADGGDQSLKNIAQPVKVWHWAPTPPQVPIAEARTTTNAGLVKPTIAVLPFINLGRDSEQEYLADGVTEDVITDLSRFRSLFVIAASSSFSYKGKVIDARRVGPELGARYVLEGSIRRAGQRVRVTVKLVDSSVGSQIWADRYDSTFDDIFELQDKLTRQIVASLMPEMTSAEIARAQQKKNTDLNAWDLYLRALPKIRSNHREEVGEAEALLAEALRRDPTFAAALARLSSCRLKAAYMGWGDETKAVAASFEYARAAIASDPDDGLGYDALASAHQKVGGMRAAVMSARRAVDLSPSSAAAHGTLISALAFCGEHEEARQVFAHSEVLSPRDPERSGRIMGLVVAAFVAGDLDGAIELARQHTLLRPNWYGSHTFLAASLAQAGHLDEARSVVARLFEIIPEYDLSWARRRRMMLRDADYDRFIEGLRRAGVPERSNVVERAR